MAYFYNFDKKPYSTLSEVVLVGNNTTNFDLENESGEIIALTMDIKYKLIITIIWSILVITGVFGTLLRNYVFFSIIYLETSLFFF